MDCFVSGCFDLLHSGHIEFLQSAAKFGRLHVAVGSDRTILHLKGRKPVYSEDERVFILKSLKCVYTAFVSSGTGVLDFERELRSVMPAVFVVNDDGHNEDKERLCAKLGIDYRIMTRVPHSGLPARSTTALRSVRDVPYRIDLAGGWLDQPFVSKYCPGAVITVCIEPTIEYDERSGLASSTRQVALKLWNRYLPSADYEMDAHLLFAVENPPGTGKIAGSQDAIGIVFPGLTKCHYTGGFWPSEILHCRDPRVVSFLERHLRLVPLGPRSRDYDVLSCTNINGARAKDLAVASERCWEALQDCNLIAFGAAVTASSKAQIAMFPRMTNETLAARIEPYRASAYGMKLCGAGGGGYLMLVVDGDVPEAMKVTVRR